MPDYIHIVFLIIAWAIVIVLRATALLGFLWMMLKFQKMDYEWLPLIGAALLASALDMVPFVGHYLAIAALCYCVWKITNCELIPDGTFTVTISYACMRCLGWILLAFAFHPATPQHDLAESTNLPPAVVVQTPAIPRDKIAADISVKGVSHGVNDSMVTIQYGKKDYIISLGEGATISTKDGPASVRFVKADENDVTLSVRGQEVKYAVK